MSDQNGADWDPRDPAVLSDQIGTYDEVRRRCPVAWSQYLHWSLFRHSDVMRVLEAHDSFSNRVSSHLSVPNGMDPPEHTLYRRMIEPYFSAERISDFAPHCQTIARQLVASLPQNKAIDAVEDFARPFALRAQTAFMGWPDSLHRPLARWVGDNQKATLEGDRKRLSKLAEEFDDYMRGLLDACRHEAVRPGESVTASLVRETVDGRPLSEGELISILRNWTVGELGTMTACVAILIDSLADNPTLWESLRDNPSRLAPMIDEILRRDAPLIANRRVAIRDVEIGGRQIRAGETLTLIWASANRDEAVFGDPDELQPDRNAASNLLYGAGIHVCPGAPLARAELRILMEAVFAAMAGISRAKADRPQRARFPVGGFSRLPVVFHGIASPPRP